MNPCILGIDLGTSSVKIIKKYKDGRIEKLKNIYKEPLPEGWWKAILELLEVIEWKEVAAIGLSSQVGTYLVNDKDVISWNEDVGKEELRWWKEKESKETFIKEISMPHPDIISYPLPRLKYIIEHFKGIQYICQPKEYLLQHLTGNRVTDMFSWRGLANLETGKYSEYFLNKLCLKEEILPPIRRMDEIAGYTKEILLGKNKVTAGVPVYTGLNDYYAGLLGMGVGEVGQMFDVTGTSEHFGVIQKETVLDSALVSGPYVKHMVHYGVTASSGSSIAYGLEFLKDTYLSDSKKNPEKEKATLKDYHSTKEEIHMVFPDLEQMQRTKPPIFLPYVKGERAPIWNPEARGVFFGIGEKCSGAEMAYAVMEGVVFSLYHIYETMEKPKIDKITVSGGASEIDCLNVLKAEVFGVPIEVVEETDVSALGACMSAAVGLGWYEDYDKAAKEWVSIAKRIESSGKYREWFLKRFEIYKELYLNINPLFQKWKDLERNEREK